MPASTEPTNRPSHDLELDVQGTLPPELSGRLMGIGPDGFVHSVHMHGGRATYVARRISPCTAVRGVVAFEGSILVLADDATVHELSTEVDTLRRVDLVGHRRVLTACPRYDPEMRELHLVARDSDGAHAHVVVPAGALTRRSRSIVGARSGIRGLALGRDDIVFVADGAVGVAPRAGEARTRWIATGAGAPHPVHAYRAGATVILLALTPLLERWVLHLDSGTVATDVVEPTARHFVRSHGGGIDGVPRYIWTAGDETISRHDVAAARSMHLDLAPQVPGDFVLVPDAARPGPIGGWFVGVVHDTSGGTAALRVIDATDPAGAAVATIRIPRRMPLGLRCEWLPSTMP